MWRNPKEALDADSSQFTVAIFNKNKNSILAESLTSNVEYPEFRTRLSDIDVDGNVQIEEGKIETFTITL